MPRCLCLALFAGIGALSLSLPGAAASAGGVIGTLPAIHVAAPGVMSYAELTERLQRQGYSDIKLTPYRPNTINPRPEQVASLRVAGDEAKTIAVNWGWNGSAAKDGQTVDIYVGRAPPASSLPR